MIDLDVHSMSQGYEKARIPQIILLHETTPVFVMVICVREMTVKKSCKYANMDRLGINSSCVCFLLACIVKKIQWCHKYDSLTTYFILPDFERNVWFLFQQV